MMMRYFTQVQREFRHIRWLTVRRAFVMTLIVIVATVLSGLLFGAIDGGYARILERIVI